MKTSVALLRGINVSGQKSIKMVALKVLMEELQYCRVQTYIQSGNIVFEHGDASPQHLQSEIEQKIASAYGFDVPTLVRTSDEIASIVAKNPFLRNPNNDPKSLHLTLLSAVPTPDAVEHLAARNYSPEEYAIEGTNVYLLCPNGYGRAILNNNFLEKKLRVGATTRNWKTMCVLAEMANDRR